MKRPNWRGYLHRGRDDEQHAARTRLIKAMLSGRSAIAEHAPTPGRGRLSGLRGPIAWLSVRSAMQTADRRIVARPARVSWGRDGVWLAYPSCRIGYGHWAPEEWLPGRGWVRLPAGLLSWPRTRHAVLPGMEAMWRRCGVEDLLGPIAATRHLRAALVHWRPVEVEVRASRITAADLLPLLECADAGVREGALQALCFVQHG